VEIVQGSQMTKASSRGVGEQFTRSGGGGAEERWRCGGAVEEQ